MSIEFHIKRIYDPVGDEDGVRVLVDRLWPRGVAKAEATWELWARDWAPSTELRRWFHADRSRWDEFADRYRQELAERETEIEQMLASITGPRITLLTATKQPEAGHVPLLLEFLQQRAK